MKKTLLLGTMILSMSVMSLSAEAFCWRNLNPANWGTCPKCEKTASNCQCKKDKNTSKCEKKENKGCPVKNKCQTTPKSEPCQTTQPCNPCDRLQQETER